jgi:hypothetical protein
MTEADAPNQGICELDEVQKSGNPDPQFPLNLRRLVLLGSWLIIIPLVELILDMLFQRFSSGWQYQLHKLVYVVLIALSFKLFMVQKDAIPAHPDLAALFKFNQFMLKLLGVLSGCLVGIKQANLILPLCLIFIGISFSLYGKFIALWFVRIAWIYILVGCLLIAFNQRLSLNVWRYELILLGGSYLLIAFWIKKTNFFKES